MWVIFKYKTNNYNLFQKNLKKKLKVELQFYNPKINFIKKFHNKQRSITCFVLNGYAFCFSSIFKNPKKLLELKYIKGLEYFLNDCFLNQKEINQFITFCKKNEDDNGNLNPSFFSILEKTKAKFLNGPFSNIVFEVIEKNKNKTKIKLGEIATIINSKSNYYYLPV